MLILVARAAAAVMTVVSAAELMETAYRDLSQPLQP